MKKFKSNKNKMRLEVFLSMTSASFGCFPPILLDELENELGDEEITDFGMKNKEYIVITNTNREISLGELV